MATSSFVLLTLLVNFYIRVKSSGNLTYAGFVQYISGGWDCDMTDDEIDDKLDDSCDSNFPNSRNIRGVEIMNGAYASIIGLPLEPAWPFLPSCPGCGQTCDTGVGRLCALTNATWDTDDGLWVETHSGTILTAECVWEDPIPTTYPTEPTHDPTYAPIYTTTGTTTTMDEGGLTTTRSEAVDYEIAIVLEGSFDFDEDSTTAEKIDIAEVCHLYTT